MSWRMSLCALGVLVLSALGQEPPTRRGGESALQLLSRFPDSRLTEFDAGRTFLVSTWDRSGGNLDGDDFRSVVAGKNILLDVRGPGEVRRISTALLGEAVRGTSVQVFIDGGDKPWGTWDVEGFFTGPFCVPRVPSTDSAGPYPTSFRPIAFQKSCRIELVSSLPEPRWGRYWQIVWTKFDAGVSVDSLPPDGGDSLARALMRRHVPRPIGKAVGKWMIRDPDEGFEFPEWDLDLEPGQEQSFAVNQSGTIERLSFEVTPHDSERLKRLRLRIFWDGAEDASIDAPIGYVLANCEAAQESVLRTPLISHLPGSGVLELPMPFAKSARIALQNRSKAQIKIKSRAAFRPQANVAGARLHATWREQRAGSPDMPTVGPKNVPVHVALDREARGQYVGLIQHVEWPFRSWWGEGDVMIWVDDDPEYPPAWHGTGNEEYFYSAWCKFVQTPFSGAISERPGDVLLHTVHRLDPIGFQDRIKVAIETVGQGPADDLIRSYRPIWGTTAFWYSDKPHPAGSTPELLPRRAHPPLVNEFTGTFEEVQARGVTRFTRDGSEPTEKSPVWDPKARFPGEHLRARTFHPHRSPSAISYVHVPEAGTPLAGQPITDLTPGESWAVFFGDFTDVPRTQNLKAVATGNETDRARIAEHVVKRGGKPVAFRTQGFFIVEKDGRYVFDLNGAQHARLTVNGRVLVAPDIDRSSSWPPCAAIDLASGAHTFVIESLIHPKVSRLTLYRAFEESERNVVPMLRRK